METRDSTSSKNDSENCNRPVSQEQGENVNLFNFNDFLTADVNCHKFAPESPFYTSKQGFKRYGRSLKHFLPYRKKSKNENVLPIDKAGFFSLITFSWMSKYIYKAYKKGLTLEDTPIGSPYDSCNLNAQRLELLWQSELNRKGPNDASFGRVVWKFVRTRVLVCCLIFSLSCVMGFLSPTIFMRKLLEYLDDPNESLINGLIWALALTMSEILRTMFFALYYSMSYRTAVRLRSACLTMIYRKVIRINSNRNISAGKIINLFSFDGPRLYYMIVFGPMAVGGPLISIFGFYYIYYILGPWALLGMIIFASYYPLQYLLSHLTGYYRLKAILQSDKRIKLITEILTSIKLIKMSAWEEQFAAQVQDVRKKELKEVKKIAYCQSVGISLAPTIPVISGIATFLIHVSCGGNLTASQAFSVLVFLTKQMKTSLQVLKDVSLALYEGVISVQRFKAFPVAAFTSKQLRQTLTQLHFGSISIVQGLTVFSRFKVYSVIVILHTQLRTALQNMRYGVDTFMQGRILYNRFKEVLMLKENFAKFSDVTDDSLALSIKDGYFMWNNQSFDPPNVKKKNEKKDIELCSPVLFSINFTVSKKSLIGVCGPVGAGKSSLLLACLGQLNKTSGQIFRGGSCAYVSQQSWIESTSIKSNILFGEKFDSEKYAKVLHACDLNEDINSLPGGEETEIGENGANLSGGQKQRIALARALYSEKDIYLLDDPFSAVDPPVACLIFENYIKEALRQKTVILVTRQMQFLQKCDEIVVMKEGRIVKTGTYEELVNREVFAHIISGSLISTQKVYLDSEKNNGRKLQNDGLDIKKCQIKKMKNEEVQIRGTIKASAYKAYIRAAGGYLICFFVTLIIFFNVGSNVFSSWWLAVWIKAGSGNTTIEDSVNNKTIISENINDNPDLPFYMQVYASIIGLIVLTCIIRGYAFNKISIRASKMLHQNLFRNLLISPMSYFEKTPVGQIQNLFSKDMDEIDSRLPESLETMLQNIWAVVFSFLSISLIFPWFVLPLILLATLYYFVSKIFRVAIRDLKRMESISRAPVFSLISATVQGLSIIHAFNKEFDYLKKFCALFDKNTTVFFLSNNAMRWIAVRLDFISVSVSFITSFLVAFLKGQVAPAYAGLALTYSAQICGVFQYTVRLLSENEARFISVERIQNIISKLKAEGNSEPKIKVASDWPSKGSIEFKDVNLSYGEKFPKVLKNISFIISGGEKIGVVGRTGSGKSSLVSALFRLVKLSSGSIYIDGINIANVPLPVLRSRLSVIPQDPFLFNGSVRLNLDPLNKFSNENLFAVLEKTRLLAKINAMPNQIHTCVGESESFSVGEKQLICLARTLLRNSKILVLDEATASIDPETESAVQKAIQEEFKTCTVIIIAHRLSTVKNCDKILVLNHGMVVEFDDPKVLIKNPNSQFAKMLATPEVQL